MSNISEIVVNLSLTVDYEDACAEKYQLTEFTDFGCPAAWDNFYCWPPALAGAAVAVPCEDIFPFFHDTTDQKQGYAYRECGLNGSWTWGNWTNYSDCIELLNKPSISPSTVSYIVLIGSIVSLIFLVISLTIFSYFKSLQCSRIRVHRNLIISLILHSLLMMIISLPGIFQNVVDSYRSTDWFCKAIMTLKMYSAMTCIYWMFVEGHLLHSSITVSVFGKETSFILYYAIGWGIPFVFVALWVIMMATYWHTVCWRGYGKSPFIWMITAPMMIALLVNSVFLINIIRILITKLKISTTLEMAQVKKAIKATALLFPLLGITHLLFCINPRDDAHLEHAYMITNAILQSSQGIFVAVLYCFLNSEVQAVLKNAYIRSSMKRHPERSLRGFRVLGSFTNTTSLSQSHEHVNGSSLVRKINTRFTKNSETALDFRKQDSEKDLRIIYEKETSFIN